MQAPFYVPENASLGSPLPLGEVRVRGKSTRNVLSSSTALTPGPFPSGTGELALGCQRRLARR
jgi:hypothetical protein